jgi:UDP-GlcNAc:undecaprenyl-phosphate GlcNAc-1-phosphate transferase
METWLAGSIAFIVSLLTTPLVIRLASRFGYLDLPTRTHPAILHQRPIPRAGGIPPLVGLMVALIAIALLSPTFVLSKAIIGIIIGSIFLVLVGVMDDKYDLNPYLRLITNFIAVGIVVVAGIGITSFTSPLGGQVMLDRFVFTIDLPSFFGFLSGDHTIVLLAEQLLLWQSLG